VNLGVTRSGSHVVLEWQTGTLLEAPTLPGPWTTNTAAVSPYIIPVSDGYEFFKILISP
jgi:hypothetical protein